MYLLRKFNVSVALFLVVFSFGNMRAQQRTMVASGTWQYHLPLNLGQHVTVAGDRIYCSSKAGLYYYDKSFGSMTQMTKQDGLNNIEISAIKYYEEMDLVLIAYVNTNIDIIQGNTIINLNDIFRKQIIGEKTINQIYFEDRKAYLGCSFGVVVIDLDKMEVKETYQSLGVNGEPLRVNDLCIDSSKIYLGTEEGVLYATVSPGVNLLDFNNWDRYINADGVPETECTAITCYENDIYAYYADTLDSTTYRLENDTWALDPRFSEQLVSFSVGSGDRMIAVFDKGFFVLNNEGTITKEETSDFRYLGEVVYDAVDQSYWAADAASGLVKYKEGVSTILRPNSPGNATIFALENIDNRIYALRGGHDGSYTQLNSPMQIDVLGSYGWITKAYQYNTASPLFSVKDVQVAKYNPNTNKIFYASHGYGVIEQNADEEFTLYNETNSNLVNVLESGPFVRVMDLDIDNDGTLWIANYIESKSSSQASFHSLSEAGEWRSYPLPHVNGVGYPTQIMVDKNGFKWAILAQKFGGGMVVFETDEDGNVVNDRHLNTEFEEGMLPDNDVRCMVEDLSGDIWVGTINGLGVYYFSFAMFDDSFGNTDAGAPPPIDGRPPLEEEVVNCIAIDAGNRKWIGTPNGAWLFDASVGEVILNFTKENSPLPSNFIIDIEIQHETGEVFIATDLGLVSFRGDATTGYVECQDEIKVFPNPVEPTFTGDIAVSGLRNGAEIKVLDMAGNLAFETEANGGGFSWNGKNYNGERVATGVYQIVVYGGDKKRSCITRVAIVN